MTPIKTNLLLAGLLLTLAAPAFAAFPDLPDNLIIEPLNLPPPPHAHPR